MPAPRNIRDTFTHEAAQAGRRSRMVPLLRRLWTSSELGACALPQPVRVRDAMGGVPSSATQKRDRRRPRIQVDALARDGRRIGSACARGREGCCWRTLRSE